MASDEELKAAALSILRGRLAANIRDPKKRKKFISKQGEIEARKGRRAAITEAGAEAHRERNRQAVEGSY